MAELRKDPLLDRWVIIAPERAGKPYEFTADPQAETGADHAEDPFAEGNEKYTPPEIYAIRPDNTPANGPGWQLRVVPNMYPALRIEGELDPRGYGLYDRMNGIGAHEVIIESPDAAATPATMTLEHLTDVFSTFRLRVEDLCRDLRFAYVLVFKNHGSQAGASIAHTHSQIIATPIVPRRVIEELRGAQAHWKLKERSIFIDILDQELLMRERIVFENSQMVAFCPWASTSPFEIHIYPRQQAPDFRRADPDQLRDLAEAVRICLLKWQGAIGNVPYNFLIHTAPNNTGQGSVYNEFPALDSYFHWHLEMFPRLTRTAGFEWGTGYYINHTPPEEAAAYLRKIEVATG